MEYLVVTFRMITVILLFLVVALLMGKRHIGELSVFDFIIAVTLAAVAGADLADPKVPHGPTILAIIGLGIIHYIISKAILKNRKAGHLLTFDPTIVMQNGLILKENLAKIRYTVDELLSHLREKGIFDLGEVEFAILEPNGSLSVLKKSQYQPATPKDLKIATEYKGIATVVILEGKIDQEGLRSVSLSQQWLEDKIKQMGYNKVEDIFLAEINTKGELYVSPQKPPTPVQQIDH